MVIHETHGMMCKHSPPGEWKLHSTVIIAGDMIDDWLGDRIIEPDEHGVVAEAVNLLQLNTRGPAELGSFSNTKQP